MALLGNYSVLLKSAGRNLGGVSFTTCRSNFGSSGALKNYIFRSEIATVDKLQALQPGAVGPQTFMLPQTAGAMVSHYGGTDGVGSLTASGALGYNLVGPLTGSGTISSAVLDLILYAVASLTGDGTISSAVIAGKIEAAASLTGDGSVTPVLNAIATAIASLTGAGSISATPYASGEMSAEIRSYGDLTPEGIRDAVWRAIASQFNDAGSMGALLNAVVDYDAVVNALLAAQVDGTTTLEESIRLHNSVLAGKVSGAGTGTERFRDLADTKDRIVATVDSSGNRTAITRDAT